MKFRVNPAVIDDDDDDGLQSIISGEDAANLFYYTRYSHGHTTVLQRSLTHITKR
jgi:hypothetical protein